MSEKLFDGLFFGLVGASLVIMPGVLLWIVLT